ncbi:hypothetical protein [Streptococcus loxodontisalivarius]|uniref:Uncharacterized protein n=1 Tax=Streptococcus loxodontisalivarius TaxID=1349415 RepID=A0ABS2PQ21_9STRE|nr:hypothetical protein [Streptococcus loxodontisalivarius]MBM7642134.1 hypothetical protein [Streptococcus loxodontisalivarius]
MTDRNRHALFHEFLISDDKGEEYYIRMPKEMKETRFLIRFRTSQSSSKRENDLLEEICHGEAFRECRTSYDDFLVFATSHNLGVDVLYNRL